MNRKQYFPPQASSKKERRFKCKDKFIFVQCSFLNCSVEMIKKDLKFILLFYLKRICDEKYEFFFDYSIFPICLLFL